MFWDFLSLSPGVKSHQVTILFSDHGTPATYRHMNGYGDHTFLWYNAKGKSFWVKYHFKTEQGVKNLTRQEADRMKSSDPDHATRDLSEAIQRGDFPAWRLEVQIMTPEQASKYRFNFRCHQGLAAQRCSAHCHRSHGAGPQPGELFQRSGTISLLARQLCAGYWAFAG